MDLSRYTKNRILILVNLVLLVIKGIKYFLYDIEFTHKEWLWNFAFCIVLFLWVLPIYQKLKHALLFLVTGSSIGITVGMILKNESLIGLEYVWVILGVLAMVLHYSRSSKDQYL